MLNQRVVMDLSRFFQQMGLCTLLLFLFTSNVRTAQLIDSSDTNRIADDVAIGIESSLNAWAPLRRNLVFQDSLLQENPHGRGAFRTLWAKRGQGPVPMAPSPVQPSSWRSISTWMPVSDGALDLRAMDRIRKQSDNWNSLKGYWG